MDVDGNIEIAEGVDYVALVDRPAIQRGFLAFREQAPQGMAFTVTSEDRHIVSGPLMLADTPIYREFGDERCYVVFPASTIECIVKKFFSQGNHANVNEMHDEDRKVEGVVMFESFITDASRGIVPMRGYEDAPEGSWFGSFAVNNDEVWASIKAGTFTGFSVEGIFARIIPADAPQSSKDNIGDDTTLSAWWDDTELNYSEEERATLRGIADILKNVEG